MKKCEHRLTTSVCYVCASPKHGKSQKVSMNRDDIIAMAREAGLGTSLCHNSVEGDRVWIEGADWHDELERFAAIVAAAEREACAKVCDGVYHQHIGPAHGEVRYGIAACAAAIRARGE